jgi:predicted secreted Zn-dependent protease
MALDGRGDNVDTEAVRQRAWWPGVGNPVLALVVLGCAGASPPPATSPAPAPPAILATPAGQAAILLAATRPTLPRGVTVIDDTTLFPIIGATSMEIGKQLKRAHSDSDYVGATAPQVQWQLRIRHVGDRCDLVGVAVEVEIRTVLPVWRRPPGASDALAKQWAAFMEATKRHENGHRNIAIATAASIARTLEGDQGLPCEGLEKLANASAQAQWALGNQHQLIYDEATLNGATQGSRWPPPM